MLNLLIGRSGSGKSSYIREVADRYISEKKKVLVIVPEQFSFETGLYFLDKNSKAIAENVKILSFSSMIKYVFLLTGGITEEFLSEGMSEILMSLAIESCSDNLVLYQQQSKKIGFVKTMLDVVDEYKAGCVTVEDLLKAKSKVKNETLKQKLEETALILGAYDSHINDNYIHNQDVLSYMAEKIAENNIFKGYNVFIDSFTGFTGQQYRVLNAIFAQSEKIYMSLSCECRNRKVDESSIRFRVTIDTYHKIRALADKCNKTINEIYEPFETNYRTSVKEIMAVEENLYAFPQKVYDIPVENVILHSANDIYKECEYVAYNIKKLTEVYGYRYKDIAVVCRDESMYRGILDVEFDKFGIGYFMDKPENINSKPLINFIRYAFDSINSNLNCENILRMLKSGITKYSYDDISIMENYIFVWSPKWTDKFNKNINGFESAEMSEEDIEQLEKIETIRSEVEQYLKAFKKSTTDTNGAEISVAIQKLIEDFDVKNVLSEKISKLDKNAPELVDEYTRVWNSVTSVVSQMYVILEHTYMSSKRYYELFSLAINNCQIANQPLCIDRVIVGTAGRARLGSPKVTFIIGAIQGVFPANPADRGVFTDSEREILLDTGLSISCGLSDRSAQEQYSAYSTLSSPSEKLYISYHTNTVNGSGTLPSTIITQIQHILPQIELSCSNDFYSFDEENIWCKQQAFEHTVSGMKAPDSNQKLLEQYFSKDEKYGNILEGVKLYKENKVRCINKETSEKLYGKNMVLTASKIEDFYQCGYLYFCKDGLKLRERRKAMVDTRYYGSLVHYVMEKFLKNENLDDIIAHPENYDIKQLVKGLIKGYISAGFGIEATPNKKTDYIIKRAEKNCIILVERIVNEFRHSKFRPKDFELSIGKTSVAENDIDTHNNIDPYITKTRDGWATVVGLVDRVDIYVNPKDGKTYIRIVDYKTGQKELKRCSLEMGLELQMFIYLIAIMKNGKGLYGNNLAPAGVCYMPAKEFSESISGKISANNDALLNKKFDGHYCAKGMFVKDPDIIEAMDTTVSRKFIPIKMTIKKKKKGEVEVKYPYSSDKLLDGDQNNGEFKMMFDLVDEKIKQMSDMLLDGYIDCIPTGKNEDNLPCRYCKYKNSCRFSKGMKINVISDKKDGE